MEARAPSEAAPVGGPRATAAAALALAVAIAQLAALLAATYPGDQLRRAAGRAEHGEGARAQARVVRGEGARDRRPHEVQSRRGGGRTRGHDARQQLGGQGPSRGGVAQRGEGAPEGHRRWVVPQQRLGDDRLGPLGRGRSPPAAAARRVRQHAQVVPQRAGAADVR